MNIEKNKLQPTKHAYESLPLDEFGNAHYSNEENATWSYLFHRQNKLVQTRATPEFIEGISLLGLTDSIPQHHQVTSKLKELTGFGVEPVAAIIQPEHFFYLLAHKKFPAANFIRRKEDMDYIMEPDVFHEIYGHCPLLTVKAYADYMEAFGKMALSAPDKVRRRLFRLFWFTIEFGLFKTENNFKAYGGGILSSKSEVIYSVEDPIAERIKLDPMRALLTPFKIDILQPVYFYIESYDELYDLMELDLIKMATESLTMKDYPKKF